MKQVTTLVWLVLSFWIFPSCQAEASFTRRTGRVAFAKSSNSTQDRTQKTTSQDKNVVCVDGVCRVNRGGGQRLSDDYDDYDSDYEQEERRRPPASTRRRPPPRRSPPTRSRYNARQSPPPPRRRRPPPRPSALSSAADLAKKSLGVTTSVAATTLKSSGKAAYYLVSPKHVSRQEVFGVWRFDQQVTAKDGSVLASCAANVEFTPNGLVLTHYDEETFESTYLYQDKMWPKSCAVTFQARAFQGPNDKSPVEMKYVGYFRRKLADSSVIKIVGNIYQVKRGWGGGMKKVGTFVARRRLTRNPSANVADDLEDYDMEEDDDEFVDDLDYDQEYDDYDLDYDSDDVYDDEEE